MNKNTIVIAGKAHRDYEWLIYFWIDEPDVSYILAVEKLFNIQAVINFAIGVALHMEFLFVTHTLIVGQKNFPKSSNYFDLASECLRKYSCLNKPRARTTNPPVVPNFT